MAHLKLAKMADGTIQVRVGRAVEYIETDSKSKGELFDAVKWAAISKGASISDVALTEKLWSLNER